MQAGKGLDVDSLGCPVEYYKGRAMHDDHAYFSSKKEWTEEYTISVDIGVVL